MSRLKAYLLCAAAYACALGVAVLVGRVMEDVHPLGVVLAADVAATVVVFCFSLASGNSSLYDPYWSVAPIAIAAYLAWVGGAVAWREAAVLVLVTAWGVRLTFNFLRGWQGLHHEDWRYVDLRRRHGRLYWLVSFAGIHLFPTLLVYLGCVALYPALVTGGRPLGGLDAAALLVTGGAIVLETLADEQLRRFRRHKKPGEILQSGLWSLCRHPNYLGEVLFWWGLYLFALAAEPGAWWSGAGAVMITALFVFVSIPMIDRRSLQRRPGYAEHMKQLPALVPRLSKKGVG